jgi:hypothetical protein
MSATRTGTATKHTSNGFRTLFWMVVALAAFGQATRLWAEERPVAAPTSWATVMAQSAPALAKTAPQAVVAQADNPLRVRTSHK